MSQAKIYHIETERLVIRCYNPSDAAMLKKSIDESLDHLRSWMPWAMDEPQSLEDKTALLRNFRGKFDLDQDFIFGIFNKDESELLGGTGLHTRIGSNAREIGYWVNVNHQGKGIITESTKALCKMGFEYEALDRIEIHCDPKNVRSRNIPLKLGFQLEATLAQRTADPAGVKRDTEIWSLFKNKFGQLEWEKMPIRLFDAGRQEIQLR